MKAFFTNAVLSFNIQAADDGILGKLGESPPRVRL